MGGNEGDDGVASEGDLAEAERESMYPMTGYALVRVDYEEPPGDALTKVGHYGRLSAVEFPADGPMTTYVVYDADGDAYDRAGVEGTVE